MKNIKTKIKLLPQTPSKSRPNSFDEEADIFVNALNPFVNEVNALALELDNLAFSADECLQNKIKQVELNYQLSLAEINRIRFDSILSILNTKNEGLLSFDEEKRALKEELKKDLSKDFNALKEELKSEGLALLEKMQGASVGADYEALNQSLEHIINLEKLLIQKDIIKYDYEKIDNFNDLKKELVSVKNENLENLSLINESLEKGQKALELIIKE